MGLFSDGCARQVLKNPLWRRRPPSSQLTTLPSALCSALYQRDLYVFYRRDLYVFEILKSAHFRDENADKGPVSGLRRGRRSSRRRCATTARRAPPPTARRADTLLFLYFSCEKILTVERSENFGGSFSAVPTPIAVTKGAFSFVV